MRSLMISAAAALLAAGAAHAARAPAPSAPSSPPADPRDWSGVWTMNGPLIFDPTTAEDPGQGEGTFGPSPKSREHPPYNAKGQALYDKILAQRVEGVDDDPIADCKPFGFPRIVGGGPGPIEMLITPKVVFMIWQYEQQIRRIYMDASHVPEDQRLPSYFGDSVGRWEGDTLVVETVDVKAGRYDRTGAPYSDQTTVVERWRKINDKTLENRITVTDPEYLSRPWTVTRTYRQSGPAGERVREFYCTDNRNPIVIGPDGKPHHSVLLSDGPAF
jgi:hypothetical protein